MLMLMHMHLPFLCSFWCFFSYDVDVKNYFMITIGGQLDVLMPPLVACHIVIHYCHVLCCIGLVK